MVYSKCNASPQEEELALRFISFFSVLFASSVVKAFLHNIFLPYPFVSFVVNGFLIHVFSLYPFVSFVVNGFAYAH